jgi:hypothetical protein
MAWVTLLKSYTNNAGKKIPVGHKVNVSRDDYKKLMADKAAVDYDGERPPKKKTKTDFFKPKNIE